MNTRASKQKVKSKKRRNYKKAEARWLYWAAFILPLKNRQKTLDEVKEDLNKNKEQFGKRRALQILVKDIVCLIIKTLLAVYLIDKAMDCLVLKIKSLL